jgi:hypothetical protein
LRVTLRHPVCRDALERSADDKDSSETALEQPPAHVGPSRRGEVRQQAPVPVATGLRAIADQADVLAQRHRDCLRCRSCGVAGAALGRVDADDADALGLAGREPDVDRVAVDDARHRAAQREVRVGRARPVRVGGNKPDREG